MSRQTLLRGHFLFTPQTGVIHTTTHPEAPSNFWRYTLPNRHLARVRDAVEAAEVTSFGLIYPESFVRWLEDNDVYDCLVAANQTAL